MWIELSEFNLKLFLPLIFPLFRRIQDITKSKYIKEENQLFKTFRYFSSYLFSFIFLIIIYVRTRGRKKEKEIDNLLKNIDQTLSLDLTQTSKSFSNQIDELTNRNEKKKKLKSFLFLILLCAIGFFCYFYRYLFEKDEYLMAKQSIGILFNIAGYIILSYFILKQKLYRHSYVSSGIIAFILLILSIISILYIDDTYTIFESLLYYFFYSFSFVTYDILKKKYMNIFFNTPYFMMLVIGITNAILVLIYDLILYLVDKSNESILKGFLNNITSIGDFFIFFLDLIIQFGWNLGIWMTIYYLTPCHYFISEYISEYIYYLENAFKKDKKDFYSPINITIFSISYFINFCCCLIFNEVVILNFCGMDYNTKKRIKERTKIDIRNTSIDINSIETEEDKISSENKT